MILTDEQVLHVMQVHGCGPAWHGESGDCNMCRALIAATERAVLEKLREPTREMLESVDDMHEDKYVARGRAVDVITRMIDAATKAGK